MSFSAKTLTRDIVTPVTIVTFVVSTVTGIMLLARWNPGLVRFSHEWLSLLFSAVGVWHLAKNWKAFTSYLRRYAALSAFGVSLAASVAITAMTGAPSSGGPGAVLRVLSAAPLEAAAPAFGLAPADAVAALKAASIDAAGSETLAAIGTRAGVGAMGVASILASKRPNPPSGR